MSGHGSEVIVGSTAPCWIGHSRASLAGRAHPAPRKAAGVMPRASAQTPMISRYTARVAPPRNNLKSPGKTGLFSFVPLPSERGGLATSWGRTRIDKSQQRQGPRQSSWCFILPSCCIPSIQQDFGQRLHEPEFDPTSGRQRRRPPAPLQEVWQPGARLSLAAPARGWLRTVARSALMVTVILLLTLIGLGLYLGARLYPEQLPWNKGRDLARIQALLQEHIAGLAAGDEARACRALWAHPPGSEECRAYLGWSRGHEPGLARSRIRVLSAEPDAHRTSVLAIVELTRDGVTKEEGFSFIVSCDAQRHAPALDCPLWLRRVVPTE
jgi:hypothetical protein